MTREEVRDRRDRWWRFDGNVHESVCWLSEMGYEADAALQTITAVSQSLYARVFGTIRKQRLFVCAIARELWPYLSKAASKRAVEVAEQCADMGHPTTRQRFEIDDARVAADRAQYEIWETAGSGYTEGDYGRQTDPRWRASLIPLTSLLAAPAWELRGLSATDLVAQSRQLNILRDMLGNPFYKPRLVFNPLRDYPHIGHCSDEWIFMHEWITPLVQNIADAAYTELNADHSIDTVALQQLSDVLEENGCDVQLLLRHLRGWRVCSHCAGHKTLFASDTQVASVCHVCTTDPAMVAVRMCGPDAGWEKIDHPRYKGMWGIDLLRREG